MEITLRGIGVSPGIAIGPAVVFDVDIYDVPQHHVSDLAEEWQRFERSINATRLDLQSLYKKTCLELGATHADIFNAHLLLLDDPDMRAAIRERLFDEHVNVEAILAKLAEHYAQMIDKNGDAVLRERVADLMDVIDRVLRHLVDAERPNLRDLPEPSIIVAHTLSPSDTANIDVQDALGLAVDSGSATSHTAILARALEVPAVMGVQHLSSHVEPGVTMIVDGAEGVVVVDPLPATLERYRKSLETLKRKREALRASLKPGPILTRDGCAVATMANIALPVEASPTLGEQAQGIGLYRTEFLFLNRDNLPGEEEQFEAFAAVVRAMAPQPVVLRTIDIGGDKFAQHLTTMREENPQLGWRAVRFCLARPDIFRVQLRAMVRASALGPVRVMFPMISGIEEMRQAKALLHEVIQDLEREKVPFDRGLKIGSMIEVPAAVAIADLLAKECDFFSIGTNDLIQYSLAVDRVNEKIAHLYEPAHPAVLRMIKSTADAANAAGISCAICGEMAGDPFFTEVLIGLGVESLSMAPLALPQVRAVVAQTHRAEAAEMAASLLSMDTADEIKQVLRDRAKQREALDGHLSQRERAEAGLCNGA